MTDEMLERMVLDTNKFADQIANEKIAAGTFRPHSRLRKWQPVDVRDMKTFWGLMIMTGQVKKAKFADNWNKNVLLATPSFGQIMSRNRLLLIKQCLHFNDNNDPGYDPTDENRDRLHKIRPLLDAINARCEQVYTPPKNLTVDESLLLYKGRLVFKQTIRTKRARSGVKLYPLCTDTGITMAIRVYSAQNIPYEDPNAIEVFSKTEQIVLNLVRPYLDKGYHLYTNHFYTSPNLASYLIQRNTHLCGTIRPNRKGYPTREMDGENLKPGEIANYEHKDNQMLAVKYREAKNRASGGPKIVCMLSNMHTTDKVDTGKETRTGIKIIKPVCVSEYKYMGGVDNMAQMLQPVFPMRKTLKWYKKVACQLLMQMILNAYKIYQQTMGNIPQSHTFPWFLVETATLWTRYVVAEAAAQSANRLRPGHMPVGVPQTGKKRRSQKDCRVCSAKGFKHRCVTTMCETDLPRKTRSLHQE